jgi:hypothetical protein
MDGRWAGLEIPFINEAFFEAEGIEKTGSFFPDEEWEWLQIQPVHLTSPYGFLRSPWNYNPSNKLSRFNNMNEVKSLSDLTSQATSTYLGNTCADYSTFIQDYAYGQPFETYLDNVEAKTISNVYFAIGGSGGARAAEVDTELRTQYGFTDDDILYLAKGSQAVYKNYLPRKKSASVDPPVKCSDDPYWDGEVFITQQPGELGGPICDCNPNLMQDNTSIATLFANWNIRSPEFLTALPLDQEQAAMSLICGRMSYDGELATSAAPLDPIFWVLHGASERLYQSVVFGSLLKDRTYANSNKNQCSGHIEWGKKGWLKGLYFEDESLDLPLLSNAVLAEYLDPTGDKYGDHVNYVYDNKGWSWCDGLDTQLATAYVPAPEPEPVVVVPTTTTTATTTTGGGGGGNPATANAPPSGGKTRPAGGKQHETPARRR